jgi:hypothetical protein
MHIFEFIRPSSALQDGDSANAPTIGNSPQQARTGMESWQIIVKSHRKAIGRVPD